MQMDFAFFLRMSQDKCNSDCNCDYFQCKRYRSDCDFLFVIEHVASNRNRLHLCCNRRMSDEHV